MFNRLLSGRYRLHLAVLGLVAGAALIAIPVSRHGGKAPAETASRASAAGAAPVTTNDAARVAAATPVSGGTAAPSRVSTPARPTPTAKPTAVRAAAPVSAPTPTTTRTADPNPRASIAVAGRSLDAYRGLGSWVDLYDPKAFVNPKAAVRDMAARGVHTLFVETSNSQQPLPIMNAAQLRVLISEAHAHGMRIVGWYLPHLTSPSLDLDRMEKAIHFHTVDGQRFDSFAVDIESTDVGNVAARNRVLLQISSKLRGVAGPSYPLGAIIPSPLDIRHGFWGDPFPYRSLARTYDAFLPMSYYTFRVKGAAQTRARTLADVRELRAQPGLSRMPIHVIGGLAEKSNPSEVGALADGIRKSGSVGGSLYTWSGTSPAEWRQLRGLTKLK